MTEEIREALIVLAKAVLEIREKAASVTEYDGNNGWEITASKGLSYTDFEPEVIGLLQRLKE